MITVLAVVHPPDKGGLHTFWTARWHDLQRFGVDVHFALPESMLETRALLGVPDDHISAIPISRMRGIRHFTHNLAHIWNLRSEASEIERLARLVDADVLVSHGTHFVTAALAARAARRKFVLFLHSNAAPRLSGLVLRLIKRPTAIACELSNSASAYPELFAGVPTLLLRPVLQRAYLVGRSEPTSAGKKSALRVLDASKKVIGFAGTFTPVKRPEKFIAVAERSQFDGSSRRFAFRIVGYALPSHTQWAEVNVIRPVAQLNDAGVDIEIVNGAGGLERMLPSLDVLILPSDTEGIPNVILEALASGTPVCALELVGVRDVQAQLEKRGLGEAITIITRGPNEVADLLDSAAKLSAMNFGNLSRETRSLFSSAATTKKLAEDLCRLGKP